MAAIFTYALLNGETFIFKEKSDVSMNIFNNCNPWSRTGARTILAIGLLAGGMTVLPQPLLAQGQKDVAATLEHFH